MTVLTVALPLVRPVGGTEFSYALSRDGQTATGHGAAPFALLPQADSLVLVVPARAVSWHNVKLPPVAASRMRPALEGALEDRLLDDPAALAFAVGPERRADGTRLVAVCDKPWLANALQFFEQGGRPAARVVPELSPAGVATSERRLVLSGTAADTWLAIVDTDSVLCAPLAACQILLGAIELGLDGVPVVAEPAVAQRAEQSLGRPVTIQFPAQGLVASGQSRWELAQFDLAISGGGRMARRWAQGWLQFARAPAWAALRWGVAGLLLANLLGLNAWAWHLDGTVAAKRLQVKALLTETFPHIRTVVDAPLQMEREMAVLRQANVSLSARDLESMLGAVGAAVPGLHAASAIEFSAGEITLRGLGLNEAQVAAAAGKLAARGYAARLDGERLLVRAGNSQ